MTMYKSIKYKTMQKRNTCKISVNIGREETSQKTRPMFFSHVSTALVGLGLLLRFVDHT
jgi:hypothetical protein